MVPLTSETQSSEDHVQTKLQAKFATSAQSFKQQEEELIKFKGKKPRLEKYWK